jgi:hypothetical protein
VTKPPSRKFGLIPLGGGSTVSNAICAGANPTLASKTYTQLTQQYNEKIESIIVIEISYQSTTGVKYIEQSIVDMSELKGAYWG